MSKYSINAVSKELVDKYWKEVSPLLEKGLLMCEGELDISQLKLLIKQGAVFLVVAIAVEDDSIKGAMALEVVNYPNFRATNIVSYGGVDLFASQEDFDKLKRELKKAGFSQIQGWCKPAQARLFKSRYGFSTPYEMIRISLTEEN